MSTVSQQKNGIFGGIAALKTVANQSLIKANGFKSSILGDANDIMSSLLEIFNQLGGYNELIQTIENILIKRLDDIENTIKGAIKTAIKQTISCGVEPTITSDLISTGVTFNLKNIDPLVLLNIDPQSDNGELVYFDNSQGVNSRDFNVFLYSVIADGINNQTSTGATWYSSNLSTKQPLVSVSFQEFDSSNVISNKLTVKINNFYLGKKLSSFISDYLDSIKLFNNTQLLSSIFDDITGTKIFSINKTVDQIAVEKIIQTLCTNILNNVDESDVIDDSFYTFSNDTYNNILEESEAKKNGTFTYNGDTSLQITVDQTSLMNSLLNLKNTDSTKISDQTTIIKGAIDNLTNDIVKNTSVSDKDQFALKLNFIQNIIQKLMSSITMFIFSPKIIYLFVMTSKLLGIEDSENVLDFVKKNINIYKLIIIAIRDVIVSEITKEIEILLAPLIAQVMTILVKEKFTIYKSQIDGILALLTSVTSLI